MDQLVLMQGIQSIANPILDFFFHAVTFLGDEEFYMIAIPLLYWWWDRHKGIRIARIFLLSAWFNAWLKGIFALPRPSEAEGIRVAFSEAGYGFPSGHAQNSVTFWGYLAHTLKRANGWYLALSLMVLIGFSRIYLGVHYVTDVLGGYLFGLVLLIAYILISENQKLKEYWQSLSAATQIIVSALLPLVLLLVYDQTDAVKIVGYLIGIALGLGLLDLKLPKQLPPRTWLNRIVVGVVGLGGLFGFQVGLKIIFPEMMIFDLLRYSILGFWTTYLVPVILKRFFS